LFEEENFNQQFWGRYQSLLESDVISMAQFEGLVRDNFEKIENEIPLQIKKHSFLESMTQWYLEVDILSAMFGKRENIVKQFVPKECELNKCRFLIGFY